MRQMRSVLLFLNAMAGCAIPTGASEAALAESEQGIDGGAIVAIVVFVVVLAVGIFRISRSDRQDRGIDDK